MNSDRPGRDVRNDGLDGDASVGLRGGQPHTRRGDPAGHGDDRSRIARQYLHLAGSLRRRALDRQGHTIDEALANLAEAVELYLDC